MNSRDRPDIAHSAHKLGKMRRQARADLGVPLPDLLLLDSKPHAVAGVVHMICIDPDSAWAVWWYGGRVGRWTDPGRPLPAWSQRDCANELADFQQPAPMMAAQSGFGSGYQISFLTR